MKTPASIRTHELEILRAARGILRRHTAERLEDVAERQDATTEDATRAVATSNLLSDFDLFISDLER